MHRKKLLIAIYFALVGITTGFVINNSANFFLTETRASGGSYGISFNSSKNKFHSHTGNTPYDGDALIHTNLGSGVRFNYYQIKGVATTWHVLGSGGYFCNTDPIHGMESIDLSFKTDGAPYVIEYSRDDSFSESRNFTSTTSSHQIFNFDGYLPNYFKITNLSGANFNISSMDISLTCLNNFPILSLTSENETMGSVSGGGVKIAGENITINASANIGYRFVGWYKGETLISDNANYSFTIGNDDLSYVARFTYQSYNLVIQSESSEKGVVSDSTGSYDYLSEVTIEATANDGYTFSGWYENNSLVSNDNPYSFNMPYSNKTYTAKFSTNNYEVLLNNLNPLLGSVAGAGTYKYKQNVTLVASANTGVSFLGWYNTSDELVSNDNHYSFNMPHENLEYTAKFAWTPYSVSLTVDDENKGSVSGAGSYIYQQEVTLTANPNTHYSFAGWYDNDNFISLDNPYIFNLPNNSLEYEARFTQNYNINVYSDDESMGTVSSPSEWGAGLEVSVVANANTSYAIDYWYDDDLNEVSYDSSYTFVMPEHDVNLYASFTNGYTLTLSSSDEAKGTVSGAGQYKTDRTVTATMNYISGTFKGWYDGERFVSNNNPYVFSMPSSNYSLEAIFLTTEEEEHFATKPIISQDGKTITYGLYPQTNVNDLTLITALNELVMPELNGWYLYEGDYYAKINATPYESNYTFDNGNIIVSGATYWFKCEPITWNILSNYNGEYYILSSALLDAHCYYNSISARTIDGQTVYANNYKYSDIRTWLNTDFYNSAFTLDNTYIQTTTVNNSAATTNSTSNSYACANTEDKIFLPSYRDYLNSDYGFSTSTGSSSTRYCKTTDWARARGARYSTSLSYLYNGYYLTRSPWSGAHSRTLYVYYDGTITSYFVDNTYFSVRPSLSLKIA